MAYGLQFPKPAVDSPTAGQATGMCEVHRRYTPVGLNRHRAWA